MLPYVVTAVALLALAASLHKERVSAAAQRRLVSAVGFHHAAQLAVVVLSLWVAVDSDRDAKEFRVAQLDVAATTAAAKHAIPILDLYFLKLLPAASAFRNYAAFDATLSSTQLGIDVLERAAPHLARQRDYVLTAFGELQRVARTILAEYSVYGDRYPAVQVTWATRTLELKVSDLPAVLSETDTGRAYAELTGNCVGFSTAAAREAFSRLGK